MIEFGCQSRGSPILKRRRILFQTGQIHFQRNLERLIHARIRRSGPRPTRMERPFRSNFTRRPSMSSGGATSDIHPFPSPWMTKPSGSLPTTRWTTSFSPFTWSRKATTSPSLGGRFPSGAIVMVSPSRTKGVMLAPFARNRNRPPLLRTACMSSARAAPDSASVSSSSRLNENPSSHHFGHEAANVVQDVLSLIDLGELIHHLP